MWVLKIKDQVEQTGISHFQLALPLLMTSQVLDSIKVHLIEKKNLGLGKKGGGPGTWP